MSTPNIATSGSHAKQPPGWKEARAALERGRPSGNPPVETAPPKTPAAPPQENPFRKVFDAGYPGVLSLAPWNAALAPGVDIQRGKAPAYRRDDGTWAGQPDWPNLVVTPAKLESWGKEEGNVGLRPGPGVLVFDIDERDKGRADRIEAVIAEVTGHSALPCRYGNGEKRSIFAGLTEPAPWSKDKFEVRYAGGQVEFRTRNAQVVVHGTHPETQRPYRWTRPLPSRSLLPNISIEQVLEIERRLEALLEGTSTRRPTSASAMSDTRRPALALDADKLSVVIAAVDALPNGAEVSRDRWIDYLHAIKAAFIDFPGTGEECWQRLSERYPENDPEKTDLAWRTLRAESVDRLGVQDILRWADADQFGKLSVAYWFDNLDDGEGDRDEAPSAGLLRPSPFIYRPPQQIPPRAWLHAQHYIKKFVSVTAAKGGTGKSSLALIDGIAMALGRQLLHDRPVKRCRVWIFNGEDPLEETERRIAAILAEYRIDPAELAGWLFVDSGRNTKMVLASETRDGVTMHVPVFDAVLAGVRANKIDALIIDPFISAHQVRESDNDAIDAVVKGLARLADVGDVAIELVHHVRKLSGAEVTVEDARGASSLIDAARSARVLTKMSADEGKRFGIDDHLRFVRFGGDPKSNMAPPPASDDTKWMQLKSVALGNVTADYPSGDNVGVLKPHVLERSAEEIKADEANREAEVVARAILEVAGDNDDLELSKVLLNVGKALRAAGTTRSTSPHVIRDKAIAALGAAGGFVVERDGHLVRLSAERRGAGARAPWFVTLDNLSGSEGASDASAGVFA